MKKWLIGVMTVLMAVSLAACTPTTENRKKKPPLLQQLNPRRIWCCQAQAEPAIKFRIPTLCL